jgi:hypothetical protein
LSGDFDETSDSDAPDEGLSIDGLTKTMCSADHKFDIKAREKAEAAVRKRLFPQEKYPQS